ncbi:MAG: sigma factor-like helix-turn-helix DNA-binding protein, partial [Planctomycetota bacterium]
SNEWRRLYKEMFMPDKKYSDAELIRLIKEDPKKKDDAVINVYERYKKYVADEARHLIPPNRAADVADFCSEVWQRAIKAIGNFKGKSVKALLGRAYLGFGAPHGIIGHYSAIFIQQKFSFASLDKEVGQDEDDNPVSLGQTIPEKCEKPGILERLVNRESREIIQEEILKLPRMSSWVIYLAYWQNCSAEDISRLCGIAETEIYWRLSQARQALRDRLARRLCLDAATGRELE